MIFLYSFKLEQLSLNPISNVKVTRVKHRHPSEVQVPQSNTEGQYLMDSTSASKYASPFVYSVKTLTISVPVH